MKKNKVISKKDTIDAINPFELEIFRKNAPRDLFTKNFLLHHVLNFLLREKWRGRSILDNIF